MWKDFFSIDHMYAKDVNLVSSAVYGLLYLAVFITGLFMVSPKVFSVWLSFSVIPFLNFDPVSMSVAGSTMRFIFGQLMAFTFLFGICLAVFHSLYPMLRLCRRKKQSFCNQEVL